MSYDLILYDGDVFALVFSNYIHKVGSKILKGILHNVEMVDPGLKTFRHLEDFWMFDPSHGFLTGRCVVAIHLFDIRASSLIFNHGSAPLPV